MSLPSNFGLLALSPTIRTNDAFLFLQTGVNGYIDMFIQSATGSPVNIMTITSGVNVASRVFVNSNGNDNTAQRESLSLPFETLEAAINAASIGDTIEVYPGLYEVNGNLFKDAITLNFYKGAFVELHGSGRIVVPELTSYFKILGSMSLSNFTNLPNPVEILGPTYMEYDVIGLGTGNFYVSGQNSSIYLKGAQKTDAMNYPQAEITLGKMILDNAALGYFENMSLTAVYGVEGRCSQSNFSELIINNSIITSSRNISQTCDISLTGKISCDNTWFDGGYYKFFTKSGSQSDFKNSKFGGGLIISGDNYFNQCVFDTKNFNYYPRNCIINNCGGYSLFTNSNIRNNNNSSYISGTYIASGSASGAANFNILGSMVSFKPTGEGTTVQFGTFTHNSTFK